HVRPSGTSYFTYMEWRDPVILDRIGAGVTSQTLPRLVAKYSLGYRGSGLGLLVVRDRAQPPGIELRRIVRPRPLNAYDLVACAPNGAYSDVQAFFGRLGYSVQL